MRVPLALCVAALGACAVTMQAQGTGTVEVGLYGQLTQIEGRRGGFDTNRPRSLGVLAHLHLNDRFGAELEASTARVAGAERGDARAYNQLVARGTWRVPVHPRVGLLLGAGLARSDYETTYNFGPNLLLGARTRLARHLALRSDLLVNHLPRSGATEIGVRVGVLGVAGPFVGETPRDLATGNRTVQRPGTVEVGTFIQQWRLDPVWNLRNGGVFGVRVGAYLTSRAQVDVESTYGRRGVAYGGEPGVNGRVLLAGERFRHTTFTVRASYQLPVQRWGAVLVGAGPVRSSTEYIDHWGVSGSVGLRAALVPGVLARGEVVANHLPGARALDVGLRLGVGVARNFGR